MCCRLLGHLYCAEALVLLDKISEALEHLNPDNVKHINLELPGGEDNDEKRIKTSPPPSLYCVTNFSTTVLFFNFRVVSAQFGHSSRHNAV